MAREFVISEVEAKGWKGFLLLEDDQGEPNYKIAAILYSCSILSILSALYVLKEAFNELFGSKNPKSAKKVKK